MIRKTTCVLLCLSMLFSIFAAGCSNESESASTQTAPIESTQATMAPPENETLPPETATEETTPPETEPEQTEPAPEPLVLSADTLTFTAKGKAQKVTCEEFDVEDLFWSIEDTSIALVAQGSVIALAPGNTVLHVYYEDREAACQIVSEVDPEEKLPYIDPYYYHQPLLRPPVVKQEVTDYFDDVIIMGDSMTYSLYQWQNLYHGLGNVLFLVRGGVSLNSLVTGYRKFFYGGQECRPEDAIAKSGRKKLYVLMGANDVPQYGIEKSMELWDELLGNILEKTPDLEIHIESLTPVWTDAEYPGFTNDDFDAYNVILRAYAEEHGYGYVDIAPYFKDSTNGIAKDYCSDNLMHASYRGCDVWVKVLETYIAEQLEGEKS